MNFKRASITVAFLILFIYGGLILSTLYFFKGSIFIERIFSKRVLFSIQLSILAGTIATFLSVFIAFPSSYALSRFKFQGKEILNTMLELPLVISPSALGAMILIFFLTPFGNFIQDKTFPIVFSFAGVVMAQFVSTVGVSTRLLKLAFDQVPQRYENVARSLGVSPLKAFLTVTVPMARRGILASVLITWAKALGEFGATITVAGSMPMKTETLPIAIFMKLASADIEGAVVLILLLLVIGLFLLYVGRYFSEKSFYA